MQIRIIYLLNVFKTRNYTPNKWTSNGYNILSINGSHGS